MKKLVSLFLSLIILMGTLFVSFNAYAVGWAASTKDVELGVAYTDSVSATDYEEGMYHYDAFKFTIPCDGTISFYLESENEWYFTTGGWGYPSFYYLYSAEAVDGNYLQKLDMTNANFSFNNNVYYKTVKVSLSAGTYIICAEHYSPEMHNAPYRICINFNANVGTPSSFKVSARNTNNLKFSWNKVGGANGYTIQRKSGDSWINVGSTSSNSYTVSNLKAGTNYQFRLIAYKKVNGTTYWGSWVYLTTPTKPSKPSIKAPSTNKKHQITVK